MGYQYKITLTEEAQPYSPRPRRIPPALIPRVKAQIDNMVEKGVIRKVEQPTDYCSPMVVTFKESGDIWVCSDLRQLNEVIKREVYQMPTFEELAVKVKAASTFTKLDC